MRLTFLVHGKAWVCDESAGCDATLPFDPALRGGRAFGLRPTTVAAVEIGGGRSLRVDDGAPVDCADVMLNPHGGGTHVECVGHIVADAWTLADVEMPGLLPATLLEVKVEALGGCGEHAGGKSAGTDRVLTARALTEAWDACGVEGFDEAIAVRTDAASALPVGADWTGTNPPYPTIEAMDWLAGRARSLLVLDLPSLDREDDGGTTPNHRRWWGLPDGARTLGAVAAPQRLICELARFGPDLAPGPHLLRLDVAPIASDAAPARVRLLRAHRAS